MINLRFILNFICVCSLLILSIKNNAQVIPTTQTVPGTTTQFLNQIPSAYGANTPINFIRTWDASMPITTDSSIYGKSHTLQEVKQGTQYFDGLGRPLQMVIKKASPGGFDQVNPFYYDDFGRQSIKYLPFVSSGTDGNFKNDPFNEQNSFYKNTFNLANDPNGEKFFYERSHFEASPLNRVDTAYASGNSWVGSAVGVKTQYLVNTMADSVIFWTIGFTQGVTPTASYYAAAQLSKVISTDESGNTVIEFKDRDERTVLKKIKAISSPSTGHYGWLCTYNVYDDIGNFRFTLPPNATDWLRTHNWIFDAPTCLTSIIARGLCFSYDYDVKNRMVIKRVPGAGELWIVYDKRDRVIMTQDSVLRLSGRWFYTNYDSLNRQVITALWTTTGSRTYHQSFADTSIIYPQPTSNVELLIQIYYDNYNWVTGSGLNSSLILANLTNTNYFYTPSNTIFPYPQAITANNISTGMKTGTKTKVLGTSSTYLYSVTFYDDRGRPIQIQSTNYSGGKDTISMQYGFSGQTLRTLQGHGKSGANNLYFQVLSKAFYDGAGRVTSITKKVGNSFEDSIVINKYDELGQLALKKIGQTRTSLSNLNYTSNPIDTLRYCYNIRGWLRGINKDYANGANSASNWFGMELNYDFGFTQSQLNGNIAGIRWRNSSDGAQRAYGFSYDLINRLTTGNFTQYTSGSWNTSSNIDFSIRNLTYDYNGNILTMSQKGLKLSSSVVIDSLVYGYNSNSNQLNYVTDNANDTTAHLGDFTEIIHNTSQDYNYDGNGSLIMDNNKGIGNIHYNYLNLPDSIVITGKGYVKYVYDAGGIKRQKITMDNVANKKTITTYLGNFVYQSTSIPSSGTGLDTLQLITHEEGRMRPKSINNTDTIFYDFFERDHLGNTRVVLTDEMSQQIYAAASLENNASSFAFDTSFYNIKVSDTISVNRIASWGATSGNNYPNNNGNPPLNNDPYLNTTATSNFVYKLNGNTGDKIGLGITLKVMTGDVVNIYAKSFWHNNTGSNPSNTYFITSVLSSFITSFAGTPTVVGLHGPTSSALQGATSTTNGLNSWLNGVPNPTSSATPKAYINWILFNEQFVPIASNCGYDPVNANQDIVKSHSSMVPISVSGYLYVYCSNESNLDVFFDNLQVIHTRGPLLEATNYYPFGLMQSGISDRAVKSSYSENRVKFNGGNELQNKEFSDGSGLELYDAVHRLYDPQLGKFGQIDPMAGINENNSPYCFVGGNPILYSDPLGLDTVKAYGNRSQKIIIKKGDILKWMVQNSTSYYKYDPDNKDAVHGFVAEGTSEVLDNVTVFAPKNGGGNSKEQEESNFGLYVAPITILASNAEHTMFNSKTWYSIKVGITYSQSINGNQFSGGKIKYAKKIAERYKFAVKAFSLVNVYLVLADDKLTNTQKGIEIGSNIIIAEAPPPFSIGWTIGWEGGRLISKNDWYRENIRPLLQDLLGIKRDEFPKYENIDKLFEK